MSGLNNDILLYRDISFEIHQYTYLLYPKKKCKLNENTVTMFAIICACYTCPLR